MAQPQHKPRKRQDTAEETSEGPSARGGHLRPVSPETGGEPMTAMQASCLKTMSENANEPQAFDASLSKREAAKRIDELKDKLGLLDPPPHTD